MEHTYQYVWAIPILPLPVIMSMGFGLFLISTATKNLRRIWAFPSFFILKYRSGILSSPIYSTNKREFYLSISMVLDYQ
jgi:hypothetical protein